MTYPVSRRIAGRALLTAIAAVAVTATSAVAGTGGIDSGGVPGGGGGTTTDPGEGVFPVRAKHTYGDGLGAGRGHDGQDLMARCGKPIVSVYSGRVQMVDTHSSAGNYVVIDGSGKLQDTVYMHLQSRASVRKGQKVAAGRGDRAGRRHRQRERLPPALRDLVEPRLLRGRQPGRPGALPARLGP